MAQINITFKNGVELSSISVRAAKVPNSTIRKWGYDTQDVIYIVRSKVYGAFYAGKIYRERYDCYSKFIARISKCNLPNGEVVSIMEKH